MHLFEVFTEPTSYWCRFSCICFCITPPSKQQVWSPSPHVLLGNHRTNTYTLEVTPTNIMRGQGHLLPLGCLISSFYLHANHSSGDWECVGLIIPNVWLIRNGGVPEGWNYPDSVGGRVGGGGKIDCTGLLRLLVGASSGKWKRWKRYSSEHQRQESC